QRVSRGPLLRCHGFQECILLVTQRISKYPVLIQSILDSTSGLQHLYANGSPDLSGVKDRTSVTAKETTRSLLGELMAAVIKQDSILELLRQPQEASALGPGAANREPRAASATGELVLLQRQHSLLQEELLRLRAAENRFKDSEKARAKLERQVRHMRACCGDKPAQIFPSFQEPPGPPPSSRSYRVNLHVSARWWTEPSFMVPMSGSSVVKPLEPGCPLVWRTTEASSAPELHTVLSLNLGQGSAMPKKSSEEAEWVDRDAAPSSGRKTAAFRARVEQKTAAVIKQDSILELLRQPQEASALGPGAANREPRAASATGELVLLQRQHSLLQEELLRLRAAENRFKDSEKARAKLERQVRHMRACCGDKPAQEPALQPGGPQESSDLEVDMTSEDEDGTASES
ncbi:unnamed protein product, partial [Tetraodon nigroviridis]